MAKVTLHCIDFNVSTITLRCCVFLLFTLYLLLRKYICLSLRPYEYVLQVYKIIKYSSRSLIREALKKIHTGRGGHKFLFSYFLKSCLKLILGYSESL